MPSLLVRRFDPDDYVVLAGYPTVHSTPAFTALVDGQIAACAGIALFPRAPVGMAWACLGPLGRQHGLFITRAVRRGLHDLIRRHGLVRVEADCIAQWPAARRWLDFLGFEDEGMMRKRGPHGEDMIRYALFPKERA